MRATYIKSWTDTLFLPGTDLTVADFNFLDPNPGGIYAAVHIGNYGNLPGTTGSGSIAVGGIQKYSEQRP